MTQRGSLTLGMMIAIGLLTVALGVTAKWAQHEAGKRAEVEGKYEAFKTGVKDAGDKAEAARVKEIARQKGVNDARQKSLQARVAASNARADSLCKSAGASAGCRSLPTIPDATRPTDDSTRDQRLLEVLRHAQGQADTLIELQEWVRQQAKP